ncbi:MAG: hypothetical protein V4559_01225 [Pseudomonadota bacterium]
MDRRTLTRIMPTVVGIGFCVIAVFKIIFLVDSSPRPDAASGHTEPALFAAALSTDWSYITHTQIIVLGVVTGTVLLLAALMVGLQFRDRFFGDDADADIEAPSRPSPPAPAPSARKGRAFGLRSGARRL